MKLADHIHDHLHTPFAWGAHDCVLFAASWVSHRTGRDCLKGLRKWQTAKQALAEIKRAGGLEAAIDARLPRIGVNFAQDGDIALAGGIVMIYSGAQLVGPGESGLVFLPRSKAEIAWAVRT